MREWPKDLKRARKLQEILQNKVNIIPLKKEPKYIAGVDAAFLNNKVIGVACLYKYPEISLIEETHAVTETLIPYIPGFLSFRPPVRRRAPLLLALRALRTGRPLRVPPGPTTYPPGDYIRPAQVFADAAHLINIPLLKGHAAGEVTLGMKNHYGSVTFLGNDPNEARLRMHSYLYPDQNPDPSKSVLTDINLNPHIRSKTRLIIGDGLFGNPIDNLVPPQRWAIFVNEDPNILFFGIDPVATDSVMCDYISEERLRIGSAAASRSFALVRLKRRLTGQALAPKVNSRDLDRETEQPVRSAH